MELNNHYLKAQVNAKSFSSGLLATTIKNLEKELADQVELNLRVEVAVDLKLKEAIDQLLRNKPPAAIDLNNVRFTEKLVPTAN
jgi:hypothetical protein